MLEPQNEHLVRDVLQLLHFAASKSTFSYGFSHEHQNRCFVRCFREISSRLTKMEKPGAQCPISKKNSPNREGHSICATSKAMPSHIAAQPSLDSLGDLGRSSCRGHFQHKLCKLHRGGLCCSTCATALHKDPEHLATWMQADQFSCSTIPIAQWWQRILAFYTSSSWRAILPIPASGWKRYRTDT